VSAVIDEETRHLLSLRYAGGDSEWVETFSELEWQSGVLLPRRRVLMHGARPDVEERVVECGPSGFDASTAVRPPPISEGMPVDETLPPGSTAWTLVQGGWPEIAGAARSLAELARARGHECCQPAHLILSQEGPDPSRWRVAVALDGLEPVPEATEGPHHLENHPESHVVGLFRRGCYDGALDTIPAVEALVRERGYVRAPGARYQVVCYRGLRGAPIRDGWALVRTAVARRAP
jgi:hypothetical protein